MIWHWPGVNIFFFWKFYPMPNHDIKNSTLASKVMFWTLPLIKCKTHQIWPTLKWKSWFFRFFSSFFTKNPCFPDKFYPSKKNPRNYNPMHIDIFFKIFTPAVFTQFFCTSLFLSKCGDIWKLSPMSAKTVIDCQCGKTQQTTGNKDVMTFHYHHPHGV